MKKSNIFYFIALAISLIGYSYNIFNYLHIKNSLTLSSSGNTKMNIYLTIIIAMIPLFVLSIWQMIKSVKNKQEVSTASIVLLVVNVVFMFGLFAYALLSSFHDVYDQYTTLINMESTLEELVKVYKSQRMDLIYTTISGFVTPVTYLATSVLALVFKLREPRIEE